MAKTYVPHILMAFSGRLGGANGTEVWTCTLRWHVQGTVPTDVQLQAACTAIVPAISAWIARPKSFISSIATLNLVKLNWIQADGSQRAQNTVLADVIPAVAGGVSVGVPYYQTQAITLRTRNRRGRGHAGRFYPPVTAPTSGADGYIAPTDASDMATSAITMIRDVRSSMASAFGGQPVPDPAVFSTGDTVAGTAPAWTQIISAVVDRVPDVQHRRTHQLPRVEGNTVLIDP